MNLFGRLDLKRRRHASEVTAAAPEKKGEERTWVNTINCAGKDLERIIQSTGENFYLLGENLKDYYARSQDMLHGADDVASLMTGGGLAQVKDGLAMILQELENHLNDSESLFSRIHNTFEENRASINKTHASMDEFDTMVLNLNMLGFLTRVENAQVFSDSSGFAALTEDVRNLSDLIRDKSCQIRKRSVEVRDNLENTLQSLAEFRQGKGLWAQQVLARTLSHYEDLSEKHVLASRQARTISERAKEIADSIGNIVMSLQYHDISRQQVEHVKDVLDGLSMKISSRDSVQAHEAGAISRILSLQTGQLKRAQDEITGAFSRIQRDLRSITAGIQDIMEESREIALASPTEAISFSEQLQTGISSVISSIDSNAREHDRITGTVRTSCSKVSDMSVFVKDIESLGIDLQLIALNARIKTARIGSGGAALDTISSGIYDLSGHARRQTENLTELLGAVIHSSEAFYGELTQAHERNQVNVRQVVNTLNGLTDSLHSIHESVRSALSTMSGIGEALLRDITETAGTIDGCCRIGESLDSVMCNLYRISQTAKSLCGDKLPLAAQAFLSDMVKIYTMESERAIHAEHFRVPLPDMGHASSPHQTDDLGENVELF